MKTLVIALVALSSSAFSQQAPVTRAEFTALFSAVARGYISDPGKALPGAFVNDAKPVTKAEVAQAMLNIALQCGRDVAGGGDAIARLKRAKLLPEDAAFFTEPGKNFRPQDLVKTLVAFADNFSQRNIVQSDHRPALTTPKIGRITD